MSAGNSKRRSTLVQDNTSSSGPALAKSERVRFAGGLTASEALGKGLVLVVVNPIPGQEERNSDHLLEEGVAIRCNNIPALAYKIDRLLDDSARLAMMRANVRRMARPRAAETIVATLLARLQK